jgi:hypothetical protein
MQTRAEYMSSPLSLSYGCVLLAREKPDLFIFLTFVMNVFWE